MPATKTSKVNSKMETAPVPPVKVDHVDVFVPTIVSATVGRSEIAITIPTTAPTIFPAQSPPIADKTFTSLRLDRRPYRTVSPLRNWLTMSLPTMPFTLYESIFNITMLLLGEFVIASAFYFIGRHEENRKLALERLLRERMEKLKRVLDRMNIEDLERT